MAHLHAPESVCRPDDNWLRLAFCTSWSVDDAGGRVRCQPKGYDDESPKQARLPARARAPAPVSLTRKYLCCHHRQLPLRAGVCPYGPRDTTVVPLTRPLSIFAVLAPNWICDEVSETSA